METNVKRKPIIHILLIGLAFGSAVSGLMGLLNIKQTDVFESLGTTVDIEESTDYYFMIQSSSTDYYTVREAGNDTYIEFNNNDSVEVSIYSIDEADYLYIEGLGANSSISINEFNVIGKVTLKEGSYLVKFNSFEGNTARDGEFKFMQADTMLGSIIRMILSFIAGVFLLIGLIVRFGLRYKVSRQIEYTTESYVTNQYKKDTNNDNDYQNLFDTDDPFEAYSNDNKHE